MSGVGACIDGVYTDSQLVSSILLGRSFFTLHLEDAIRCCLLYFQQATDAIGCRMATLTRRLQPYIRPSGGVTAASCT